MVKRKTSALRQVIRIQKRRQPKSRPIPKTETKPTLDPRLSELYRFMHPVKKGVGTLPGDLTLFQSIRLRLQGDDKVTNPYKQHAVVYSCINAIAINIAGMPFKLYTGDTKSPTEIEDGELYKLFKNPNPVLTREEFIKAILIHLGNRGECAVVKELPKGKERDPTAIPTEMWPMSGANFEPNVVNGVLVGWTYKNGKEKIPLSLAQVIFFKYYDPDNPFRGLSPISAARTAIDQDWKASRYNAAFFDNSADPGGIITYDPGMNKEGLTDDQRDAIRENWEDRHKGVGRARRIAILEGGLKYQRNDVSHQDMQFLEQRKFHREEIAMCYRVPKTELTLYEDVNYATALSQDRGFWHKTLLPIARLIEGIFEAKFFMPITDDKIWGAFDTSIVEALQEDFHKKVETGFKLFQMHVPFNEINDRLELGFKKLAWGDVALVPLTVVPITDVISGKTQEDDEIEEESIKTKQTAAVDYDKFWVRYVKKILDPNEKRFQNKMKWYFYQLRADQLARLAEAEETLSAVVAEKTTQKVEAFELDSILFVQEEWDKKLKATTRPLYENIMIDAGEELAGELGGLFQFDLTDPAMLRFMNQKLSKVTLINANIRKSIRITLMEGIALRETIGELQNRVRVAFNFLASPARSLTIARTETATTASGTRFLAMEQEGIKTHRWVTAGDEQVRTSHREQNRVVRPVGRKFPNGLRYPSDINGSAREVINCRCLAVPVVKE